ncbi:MAG: transposase [Phycisphaerales bacterium]|nr:transposase [Phycisphaerales bacterium]
MTAIGVDDFPRRGHNYISVFMDLGNEPSRVLFATEGKDARTVAAFKRDLEAHGGRAEQIEEACLDMSAAFINGLREQFPEAQLTFDNFHLMKLLGLRSIRSGVRNSGHTRNSRARVTSG